MSDSKRADTSPLRHKIRRFVLKTLLWGRDHVPPVIRSLIGVLFCIGGVFGFLPVLGFWMFPLGLAFIALDIPGLRSRLDRHIDSLEQKVAAYEAQSSQ
ncbi:MAG: hypothetical protein AB8B93_13200 [Pseudomonadales bacterium]